MHDKTVVELSAAFGQGNFSSEELTRACLERVAALDGRLNSFITVTQEQALAAARAADTHIAAGEAGPLTGIPFAHKDIFCTDGVLTTCGSHMLSEFVAPYSATVVEKLNDAGMVIPLIGKLSTARCV